MVCVLPGAFGPKRAGGVTTKTTVFRRGKTPDAAKTGGKTPARQRDPSGFRRALQTPPAERCGCSFSSYGARRGAVPPPWYDHRSFSRPPYHHCDTRPAPLPAAGLVVGVVIGRHASHGTPRRTKRVYKKYTKTQHTARTKMSHLDRSRAPPRQQNNKNNKRTGRKDMSVSEERGYTVAVSQLSR